MLNGPVVKSVESVKLDGKQDNNDKKTSWEGDAWDGLESTSNGRQADAEAGHDWQMTTGRKKRGRQGNDDRTRRLNAVTRKVTSWSIFGDRL